MIFLVRNGAKKIYYFFNWLRFALGHGHLSHLDSTAKFNNPSAVKLGKKSSVNSFTFFDTPSGNVQVGENVKIGDNCRFTTSGADLIKVGNGTSIHGGCHFTGDVEIGEGCLLARNIFLSSYSHQFKLKPGMTIKDQDRFAKEQNLKISKKIIIEDDVWLSWGCLVLPGVRVAKGSIIGANAVVTKDTEQYGIYGGVPAKKISSRNT
jgi:acetyltransferase-like isoleucine patch superfamily enzyme